MKASQQLTCRGYIPQYSFLHSAVQDFLCAVWMSTMDEEEQMRYVSLLLSSDPMSPILQFFAGCTQLNGKSHKTLKLLVKEANIPFLSSLPVTHLALNPCESADYRRVQLAALYCIYESQQEEAFVQLRPKDVHGNHCLCFDHYHLSSFKCRVIGQFLSSVLTHMTCSFPIFLKMEQCRIGDHEVGSLLQPMFVKMSSLACTTTLNSSSNTLALDLCDNNITHVSVKKLKFLTMPQHIDCFELFVGGYFINALTNRYVALKHLIECLHQKRCSLRVLDLANSGLTEQHMYHLILLLIHSHSLELLNLKGNILSSWFSFFSLGLQMNKCLTKLSLNSLHLANNDIDVLFLADALHGHSKLSTLIVAFSNPFRPSIFTQFLQKVFAPSSRSCLSEIWICEYQYHPMRQQLEGYQDN